MKTCDATIVLAGLMLLASCTKEEPQVPEGKSLGERIVSSKEGYFSVLVRTEGDWRLRADENDWLTFDSDGGYGAGVFTLYYDSNESSLSETRLNRMARIFVTRGAAVDTLYVKQRGMPVVLEFFDQTVEVPATGAVLTLPLSCNLTRRDAGRIRTEVSQSWVGNPVMDAEISGIELPVGANTSPQRRQAELTLSFTDDWGDTTSAVLSVIQKGA